MEPLKVGDMVVIVSSEINTHLVGMCGTILRVFPEGMRLNFRGYGERMLDEPYYMLDRKTPLPVVSTRRHLLKITPPPTMTETEKEATCE